MVTMKLKNFFFDRKIVNDALSKKDRASMSKAGAFIRQRAKTSMRKRKKPSAPGQPPSSHQGDLRRLILFGYDFSSHTVVVGPVGFNAVVKSGGSLAAGVVPSLLEFGGTVGIRESMWGSGEWMSGLSRRQAAGKPSRVRKAHYRPRPYMGPALAAETPNLAKCWRGVVGGR